MSSHGDRIQSLVTGLDRILEPAKSAYSRLEWDEGSEQRQISEKIRNEMTTPTATRTALDSSVPEVEVKEPIEFRDDLTREKPPPQMSALTESSHPREV